MHAWNDSTIALAWIPGDPSLQKVFVSNRTAEVQSIFPPKYWHHGDKNENPEVLISRGASLENLRQNEI